MNYRRGLQRLYAAFTVAWVVVILTLGIRHRPRHIDWDAIAKDFGATIEPPSFETFIKQEEEERAVAPTVEERVKYWEVESVVALVPPVFGYALLFALVPWTYKGLKPGTHN